MNVSQIYIVIAIVALAVVVLLVFVVNRNQERKRVSPLTGLAFAFILAGILFGENRWIGYGLMGLGLILAIFDMFRRSRSSEADRS